MTEQEFTRLLDRFEKGLCTREEQTRLEKWLDSMDEGESAFRSAEEKERTKKALFNSIHDKAEIRAGRVRSVVPPVWMKVAATVLMLVLTSYLLIRFDVVEFGQRDIAIETQTQNEVRKIILSDGSIIWLKAHSRLSYPETFREKERVVSLVGEALFEIAKDPVHPFIIHTGGLSTRVLGTSFNIRNTSEHTEVYVLTGKVSVTLLNTNQKVELLPQERAMYSHASNHLRKEDNMLVRKPPIEYTRGTQYNMHFQDTKVSDIARGIEGKFNVEVSVLGDISSCVVTADLTGLSLNNTLDLISEALNATYELDGDEVILRGDGCE